MSAAAQSHGIKPISYAVVVNNEARKWSFTMGPFRTNAKADEAVTRMSGLPGVSAWVDPIYAEQDAARILELERRA